jgi:hypothetical protein
MTMNKLATLIATVGFASIASADSLPKEVDGMNCLAGSWKATGTVSMGKDSAKVNATWDCKRTSAKWGVLCSLNLKGIPGLASYAETDLFGFEPNSRKYHWFSVTNAGETHDHVADFTTGNKLEFVYTGTQEGKPFKEVIDMTIGDDDKSFTLRSETFVDGASTSVLDIKARK